MYFGDDMSENSAEVLIELSLMDGDSVELDELTRQLRSEVQELDIESVHQVSEGVAPAGTKGVDMAAIGQMAISLAPSLIPPLFDLLKSWVERKPSTPVKVTVKVGRKTAQIEYDPTKTSAKDLDLLVQTLHRSMKK
jgi:hypothetical protein